MQSKRRDLHHKIPHRETREYFIIVDNDNDDDNDNDTECGV